MKNAKYAHIVKVIVLIVIAVCLLLFIFYINFDSGLMRKPAELETRKTATSTKLVD
ncbi:hypothetical protein [Elizabethkingia anophelis]|uniref:hypothetical protein n=1 Tax=Elizabethkingia anophelis TaxID=1117645 RepID=UPI00301BA744